MTAHFGNKPRRRKECDDGHGSQSLANLEAHLVLEELGVLEGRLVENKNVRETGADEIVDQAENPASQVSY